MSFISEQQKIERHRWMDKTDIQSSSKNFHTLISKVVKDTANKILERVAKVRGLLYVRNDDFEAIIKELLKED